MFVIARPVIVQTEVSKSRFHCRLERVADLEHAEAVIAQTRRSHPQARHHCVALRIGPLAERQRSTDDGEPSGTAGAPMLDVLTGLELTDVLAVVTRYFGGTLLGTGGLVRAYSGAVHAAAAEAGRLRLTALSMVRVTVPAIGAGRFEHALRAAEVIVDGVDYLTTPGAVDLRVLVPPAEMPGFRSWVAGATAGAGAVKELGRVDRAVPT